MSNAAPFKNSDLVYSLCRKCLGKGKFEQWARVEDGICFRCDGTGQEVVTFATAKKRAAGAENSLYRRHFDQMLARAESESRLEEDRRLAEEMAKLPAPTDEDIDALIGGLLDGSLIGE